MSINPTASQVQNTAVSPCGRWKITVSTEDMFPIEQVQAWISRDEALPGHAPFGRQPHFDNANCQMFDAIGAPLAVDPKDAICPGRRAGTISEFATGPSPVVVACFTGYNGEMSDHSAAGPVSPVRGGSANRLGPDAAAVSEDSPAQAGILGAGNRRGSLRPRPVDGC